MNGKKKLLLVLVPLILITMACTCNLFRLLFDEKDVAEVLVEELIEEGTELLEEVPEDVVEDVQEAIEEGAQTLEDHADQLPEIEEAEEIASSVLDDLADELTEENPPVEMGKQPNWSYFVTGCEEYFEEGELFGFYPSENMDEIEFTGDQHMVILSMTKSWRDEEMWFSDYTDNDLTNNNIDFVIYDDQNESAVFLPDFVSFYWEYDGDEQHIFGIIEFDARAYDSASQVEISPECVISGQFTFDNISIEE